MVAPLGEESTKLHVLGLYRILPSLGTLHFYLVLSACKEFC